MSAKVNKVSRECQNHQANLIGVIFNILYLFGITKMTSRRALHFVFKIGNRTETARFLRNALGMKVCVTYFEFTHHNMVCLLEQKEAYIMQNMVACSSANTC